MKAKAARDDTAIGLALVKQGVVPDGRDVKARLTPRLPLRPSRELTHDVSHVPSDFLQTRRR